MINNRGFYSVTQVKFADLLGIKLVTYQKWEQGVRNPSSPSAFFSYASDGTPAAYSASGDFTKALA